MSVNKKESSEKIPEQRNTTIRREIQSLLDEGEYSISELSKHVRKSEKEICDHLEHLLRTRSVRLNPARCLKCEFVFDERLKANKPGKCPKCKATHIEAPTFISSKL
ncbi:ArsR family transcriptional regulator [Hahella ganghwensis]|uniref:ArsR family transcriptional regulator n=1 Tax=Hahella ganghwensis TaxID=286420 RepID=UPI000372093C|nr:ArsR family transcriptional regulator [Hahella ganghwensis]